VQLGERYYPKLQCAVPFSPVPGSRLLVAPGEDPMKLRNTMLRVLPQVAEVLKVSAPALVFCRIDCVGSEDCSVVALVVCALHVLK
jgi:uncharacterized protein